MERDVRNAATRTTTQKSAASALALERPLPVALFGLLLITTLYALFFLSIQAGAAQDKSLPGTVNPSPFPFDGKYGYVDSSGRIVVPPRFDKAGLFSADSPACVKVGEKWGYIDAQGNMIVEPVFEWARDFSAKGLAPVKVGGKWGYINTKGEMVVKPSFDDADPFSDNGLAPVKIGDKKGYIDEKGEMVIKASFDATWGFHNGLAAVYLADKDTWGYIDEKGTMIIKPVYSIAYAFSPNGLALVLTDRQGKFGYINTKGEMVIKASFDEAAPFAANGLALIKEGETSSYIDAKGQKIIGLRFDCKYGCYDANGNPTGEPRISYAGTFAPNGLAAVQVGSPGKYGFIDERGHMAIEPAFAGTDGFQAGGLAVVYDGVGDVTMRVIDGTGNILLAGDRVDDIPVLRNGAGTVVWPPERAASTAETRVPWTGPGLFRLDPAAIPGTLPPPGAASGDGKPEPFEGFLATFAEDVNLLLKSVVFPLPVTVVLEDPKTGDYAPQTLIMQKDDSGAPLVPIFPSRKTREAEGREYKLTPQSDGRVTVTVFKEDTDWKVDYIFTWREGGWRLTAINDQSM